MAAAESEGRQAAGRGTDVGQRIWQVRGGLAGSV